MRDGAPLPGLTPAQLVSQLTHRVFGPLQAMLNLGGHRPRSTESSMTTETAEEPVNVG